MVQYVQGSLNRMNTYEAYVRIQFNNQVIKTILLAENSQQAIFLLQAQYGTTNIVRLPRQLD